MRQECYMCSSEATSREHVPPLCIFPEVKDLPDGINYRKNLIKVPSCEKHNLRTSGDDEYFFFLLVSNWAINSSGLRQWATKAKRSLSYRPSKRGIFKNPTPVTVQGRRTGIYNVEIDRINSELEKISRGIYYHHYHNHWLYEIEVVLPAAIAVGNPNSKEYNNIVQKTTIMARQYLADELQRGDNPEVFYYQYKFDNEQGYILRMVFYGGVEVITLSSISKPE